MSIYTRALKFWLGFFLQCTGIIFGMIVLIVALTSLFDGGDFLTVFLRDLPVYLLMACVMMIMVYGFTAISIYFPMSVTFGSRRSPSIIMMCISEHIISIVAMAVSFGALLYTKPELRDIAKACWPFVVAVLAAIMVAGNLVSLLSNRFGRVVGIIIYIVMVFSISVCLGLVLSGTAVDLLEKVASFNVFGLGVLATVIVIILDILSVYGLLLSVRKKDLELV